MRASPADDALKALAEWKRADHNLRRATIAFFNALSAEHVDDRNHRAIEAIRQHIVEDRDRTPAAIHDAAITILEPREQRCHRPAE